MRMAFVTNFLNPHMLPLCEAFNSNPKIEDFKLIALERLSNERMNMGFVDMNSSYQFVCRAYESDDSYKRALQIVKDVDVAIIGEAPDEWISCRMEDNKLTFLSSERFYRLGLWRRFVPSSYRKKKKRFLQYKDKKLYYLTIGAYLPYELHLLGFPIEKCFQWAYFPEVIRLPEKCPGHERKHGRVRLLWVGRLIKVKHPEMAIKIAEGLIAKNIDFELSLIGSGVLYTKLKLMIEKKDLKDWVKLLGNCEPREVQKYMVQSDIILFTSDYREGWGAVLSEAMAHGCIPVASYKAGASYVLIENGRNGFIYHSADQARQIIKKLYKESSVGNIISANAKENMEIKWSPSMATDRFVAVADSILSSKSIPRYTDGPMGETIIRKARNYIGTSC